MPVPEALAVRARELAAGRLRPVAARPASTVVLLRDHPAGLQVYLLRRRTTMAFAAGMYAFPGGAVDPRDHADSESADSESGGGESGGGESGGERAWEYAAARELFEETGVLLAAPAGSVGPARSVGSWGDGDEFEADRPALLGKEMSFREFLERHQLVLRHDLLVLCGHWVTPEAEPRRYDTRFYLAALPDGQRTRDVSGEADRVAWMRPADAEAAVLAGDMRMLPPTAATLAALVPMRTVEEALAAARFRPVVRIQPSIVFDGPDSSARWSLT